MNWTPILAAALGPLVVYLISRLSNGPEEALRKRVLDDIKIRDALGEGTVEREAYDKTILLDVKRIHNLRDIVDAQRSSAVAMWVLGTTSVFFLVGALSGAAEYDWPLFAVSVSYFAGFLAMLGARSRIKRFRARVETLDSRSDWIWRNALAAPFTMNKSKVDEVVRRADGLIAKRIISPTSGPKKK